jgi:hypothetical protein
VTSDIEVLIKVCVHSFLLFKILDMAGSLDHTSPLSLSVTSSEGLSASLRSVPEIKNLQALVQQSMNINSSSSNNSNLPSTSISFEQK